MLQSIDWIKVIDIAGLVLGLIYLWLEYRASIWLWAVSIIMPIVHSYLYFAKGLYADFGMEFYYVVIVVYGYYTWRWGKKDKEKNSKDELPITNYNRKHIAASLVTWLVLWALIYWVLVTFTDSRVPVLDSFTTALSAVAMWALAKKYVEQWLLWFVVDAVSCGLYIYKEIPFNATLYGLYTVIAVAGYFKWLRLMQNAE